MKDTNVFVFSGRIAKDIEMSYTPTGTAITRVTVASSNDRYNKSKEAWDELTDWLEVTFFGKVAESYAVRNGKGDKVIVQGEIHQHDYIRDDGQKVRTFRVTGNSMQTVVKKNRPEENGPDEGFVDQGEDEEKAPF